MSDTVEPAPKATPYKFSIAMALIVAGTGFMENLDGTVIGPALPAMARDFAVHPVDLNIGIGAYMLTLGVFIPISGWIADRFGARRVFSAAIAIFTLASLLCATATSLIGFVLFRVLQGIGGAMMVPVGRLVVLRVAPKERLLEAIALLTWPTALALVLGPPLGGLITDHANWRWIFFVNLPLGAIALIVAWFKIPEAYGERRPFDGIGFVLTGISLFSLLVAAELMGQADIDWANVVVFIGVGLIFGFFAVRHLKRCPYPLIDLGMMRVQTFSISVQGGSLFRLSLGAVPFLLPLMFQMAFGYSAFASGLMMMAVFAGYVAMKPAITFVMRRYGFRRVLIVNGILNAISIAVCAFFDPGLPMVLMVCLLFAGGLSRTLQFTAYNTLAYLDVPKANMNAANTLAAVSMQLSSGMGVALGAISWRIGLAVSHNEEMSFRIAFILVTLVMLAALWDSFKLPRNTGAHLMRNPNT